MLEDNYGYVVHQDGIHALAIDPSESEPVLDTCAQHGLTLQAILFTHHHHDHVGGAKALKDRLPHCQAFSSVYDRQRLPVAATPLEDESVTDIAGMPVRTLAVPGHTLGAVAYLIGDALFTGDTLFVAGCGRLFEGTPEQMHQSLARLAALPNDTRIYCGHEYADKNLRFAQQQGNQAAAVALESLTIPSVPSPLWQERTHNVFLGTDLAKFTLLRAQRNVF